MGVKSTHYITRHVAIQVILNKIITCTDAQLEGMLEGIVDSPYHNFAIVDEERFEKNKTEYIDWKGEKFFSGSPYIETPNQLDLK